MSYFKIRQTTTSLSNSNVLFFFSCKLIILSYFNVQGTLEQPKISLVSENYLNKSVSFKMRVYFELQLN